MCRTFLHCHLGPPSSLSFLTNSIHYLSLLCFIRKNTKTMLSYNADSLVPCSRSNGFNVSPFRILCVIISDNYSTVP